MTSPGHAPVALPLHRREPAEQRVEGILLEVIAEKTGYPTEMLELDMALDADLGIDSIKRVEILSALQERLPERRRSNPSISAPCTTSDKSPPSSPARTPSHRRTASRTCFRDRTRSRSDRLAGGDRGEDGLSDGDAGTGHGPGRRPGHRLHQARGDPVGLAGTLARRAADQTRAPRHPAQPPAIAAFLAGSSSNEEQPRKEAATAPVAGPFDRAASAAPVAVEQRPPRRAVRVLLAPPSCCRVPLT